LHFKRHHQKSENPIHRMARSWWEVEASCWSAAYWSASLASQGRWTSHSMIILFPEVCFKRKHSRIPGEALRLHITSTWMSHSYSTTVIFGQRQATVPSQVQGEKTTPRCQYKEAWSVVAMVVFEGSHTLKNNWNLI
jgi:hypothetical protein